MIIKKPIEKSPFQWNLANNYLQNRQGKKHYWGIGGKDYGLVQSPQDKRKKQNESPSALDQITSQDISFQSKAQAFRQHNSPLAPHNYHTITHESNSVVQTRQRLLDKFTRRFNELEGIDRANMSKQQYIRTQPNEQYVSRRHTIDMNLKQAKKINLSLFSRNVNIKNEPSQKQLRHIETLQIMNKPSQFRKNSILSKRERVRTQHKGQQSQQMNQYRQRIVKVIRRDRMNNPTFCNSRNYPLNCYRYVS